MNHFAFYSTRTYNTLSFLFHGKKNMHICFQTIFFDKKNYSGKVLGTAHPACNRERIVSKYIPVYFHNLKGLVMLHEYFDIVFRYNYHV
jgi:hypothetical protein